MGEDIVVTLLRLPGGSLLQKEHHMATLRVVSIKESPCLGCLRERQAKEKCAGKCDRMSSWRELDLVMDFFMPVPIERVRLCDIPQGESCIFRISDRHVVWRGD